MTRHENSWQRAPVTLEDLNRYERNLLDPHADVIPAHALGQAKKNLDYLRKNFYMLSREQLGHAISPDRATEYYYDCIVHAVEEAVSNKQAPMSPSESRTPPEDADSVLVDV